MNWKVWASIFLVLECVAGQYQLLQHLDASERGVVASNATIVSIIYDGGLTCPIFNVREKANTPFNTVPVTVSSDMVPHPSNVGLFGDKWSMSTSANGTITVIGGTSNSMLYLYTLSSTSANATVSLQTITCSGVCPSLGWMVALSGDGNTLLALDTSSVYLFNSGNLVDFASFVKFSTFCGLSISYDGTIGAVGYATSGNDNVISVFSIDNSHIVPIQNLTLPSEVLGCSYVPGLGSGKVLLVGDTAWNSGQGRVLVYVLDSFGRYDYKFQVECPTTYPGMCGRRFYMSPDDTRWIVVGYNGCYSYQFDPETLSVKLLQPFSSLVPAFGVSWDTSILAISVIDYGSGMGVYEAPPA